MTLHSTLFLLLLSTNLVFGHLRPNESHEPWKGEPSKLWMREKLVLGIQTGNKDWSMVHSPDKISKDFYFSEDNDHESDSNGEYFCATLEAGALSESFTICSAFIVEATDFSDVVLFTLLDNDGITWAKINLWATPSYTEYSVHFGRVFFFNQT